MSEYWAIFKDGEIVLSTISETESSCITRSFGIPATTWRVIKKDIHTCRKVEIKEVSGE